MAIPFWCYLAAKRPARWVYRKVALRIRNDIRQWSSQRQWQ